MSKKNKKRPEEIEMDAWLDYVSQRNGSGTLDDDLPLLPSEKKGKSKAVKYYSAAPRCHTSHPVLSIGGGKLAGGSCTDPLKDYDVYVGLGHSMSFHAKSMPWAENRIEVVHFPVQDYGVPPESEVEDYVAMAHWLCSQLQEGKKIHIGCMGGHGRTGMLMAAIVGLLGNKDAIVWLRANYCKKAVESGAQVDFLAKHFGLNKAPGAKSYTRSYTGTSYSSGKVKSKYQNVGGVITTDFDNTPLGSYTKDDFQPIPSNRKNLWRD